jgi:ankyrin repeat protein
LSTVSARPKQRSSPDTSGNKHVSDFTNKSAVSAVGSSESLPTKVSRTRLVAPPDSPIHVELCEAAREGHRTARLDYLLSQGADINAKDASHLTALYYAAARGDQENVKLLLNSGANVNSRHRVFRSPIWIAALRGRAEIVQILLDHNADISAQIFDCVDGMGTVMHCAFFSGDIATVRCLLKAQTVPKGEPSASNADEHETGWRRSDSKSWRRERPSVSIVALRKIADERFEFPVHESGISQIMRKPMECEWHNDRLIKCSPLLMAADCGHFELLRLCWSEMSSMVLGHQTFGQPDAWLPSDTWEFETYETPRPSNNSVSGWSCFGFPDLVPRQSESTLLMWAAASLNLRLIDHLLDAGASVHEQDSTGRTPLHYAASPFEDALFSDLDKCVQRLTEKGATISTSTSRVETLLQLAVGPEHAALDPRNSRRYGSKLHTTCIKSIIDNAVLAHERQAISRIALRYALCNKECPLISIELLCKYGGASDTVEEAESTFSDLSGQDRARDSRLGWPPYARGRIENGIMRMTPLQVAIMFRAKQAVILTLLAYGADPKLLTEAERKSAIFAGSFKKSKESERESRKKVAVATLSGTWLQSIPLLPGLFRPKPSRYIEPRKSPQR